MKPRPTPHAPRICAFVLCSGLGISLLSGCETDSFLDPSVTGRWEVTPTVMPILDRLSAIEDEADELVASTPITQADLIPEPDQYRIGPGDTVEITLRDFFIIGAEETIQRTIDGRGNLEIPKLPPIRAQGRTSSELTVVIEDSIRNAQINDRPVVSVNLLGQRKQTFSVLGAVRDPGTFFIPAPDYRILEGLTAAGGVDENIPFIYVIRQVALSEEAAGALPPPEPATRRPGPPPVPPSRPSGDAPKAPDELIDLIDELSRPPKQDTPPSPVQRGGDEMSLTTRQPEKSAIEGPAIDLPDAQQAGLIPTPPADQPSRSGWIYRDGQWVQVTSVPDPITGQAAPGGRPQVTQRKIKVPVSDLLAGDASVNIVLRPGDVIRVPPNKTGLVYVGGQVARPGVIALPSDGRLTLLRLFDSVGGLNSLAIPERTDITRIVGEGRQATIRVNVRAIAEQTQPDIYMKPDDRVNVGTNFFALPLAVLRGGFRASYGFGFILDRNFQGDVFGVDQATAR